jgi:hypothetical protein
LFFDASAALTLLQSPAALELSLLPHREGFSPRHKPSLALRAGFVSLSCEPFGVVCILSVLAATRQSMGLTCSRHKATMDLDNEKLSAFSQEEMYVAIKSEC